jgi:trans-2,3-dihydro-3-hydroxyanthranilate isomerase
LALFLITINTKSNMKPIAYYHVDVFSDRPFSGNGLTVFTEASALSKAGMLKLTKEMRQFESIFLQDAGSNQVRVNVFTCEEELDFAGHPILGAAATLHDLQQPAEQRAEWSFVLNKQTVTVITEKDKHGYKATMNQGRVTFGSILDNEQTIWLLNGLNLSIDDLYPGYFPSIVSTGLPYVIIPLKKNSLKAKLGFEGMEEKIRAFGAMFIGVIEIPTLSIRTGDNLGMVEDIATGSLAGPAGAFLVNFGFQKPGTLIKLNQGKNLGRPSSLFVEVKTVSGELADVYVSGHVCKVSQCILLAGKYL